MAFEVGKLLTRLTRGIRGKLRGRAIHAPRTDEQATNAARKLSGAIARDNLKLSAKAQVAIAGKVPAAKVEMVPLDQIRYTQAAVYHDMKDGRLLSELAAELKAKGWDITKTPPQMVRMPDGFVVTLDHRRLIAAQQAGLKEVPALVHPWNEPLPALEFRRYWIGQPEGFNDVERGVRYTHKQVAQNWGEAVRFRSIEQRLRGYHDFPLGGSPKLPELKGMQPRD